MFIELVDALRCPVPHEASWLVASATRMKFRHIVAGTLGCPVCHAEYPVSRGVADFRRAPRRSLPPDAPPDEGEAMRLAAFLDLSDRTGIAVLLGSWSVHAALLRRLVETPLVIVDPPEGTEGEPGISALRCDGELPLVDGVARGMAVDRSSPARVASAVRATRAGGRLVLPADLTLPTGVRELARDADAVVAERVAMASPPVMLHLRRRS